jgi:Raf kinase inhibitor-like YbhB/YbcL family protein
MKIESTAFADGARLPKSALFDGMGVGGDNRSPHLRWTDVPEGTQSFAVIVHDPDAPTGTGFFHWIAFNIPADCTELAENAGEKGGGKLPAGAVHGHTDFGTPGYGGAAPPPGHGDHRYEFHVYALDVPSFDLGPGTTAALLRFMMLGHTLAEATYTGTYGR